ncbi:hypothetical protein LCGC14_1584820 [marine sediment metagenome]|uniref:Uncharacterized protein n=1 Tax=marine sediment metagenome TaxID=412755 RepID=A0A0F9J1W2_9ZZZZ
MKYEDMSIEALRNQLQQMWYQENIALKRYEWDAPIITSYRRNEAEILAALGKKIAQEKEETHE